ncbi:hypothetical protein GUJ93_ZPchr0007g5365 [Zizania palustris]|uniref:Uncharacterized protein n=1 Tax=Zizania palustris TaxID=103762 RepID=A0A8J5TAC9_ZIZPA|nr:hypothetical protein GUJ93_ZPchr0007g5365 [Zizania palustris]
MPCLGRAAVPVKRVWLGLTARLGLRRTTGLGKLRKEVSTCEYSDVHVMWEMLSTMDAAPPRHGASLAGKRRGGGGSPRPLHGAGWSHAAALSDLRSPDSETEKKGVERLLLFSPFGVLELEHLRPRLRQMNLHEISGKFSYFRNSSK